MNTQIAVTSNAFVIDSDETPTQALAKVIARWPGRTLKWYDVAIGLLTRNRQAA